MIKYLFYAIVSILYLLNFTLGVFEIPDNLPFVGNIDEFAASGLLIYSVQKMRELKRLKNATPIPPEDTKTDV